MLYFDASVELSGLVCYRDYSDPSKFYYLPRSPRLSMEGGEPMFQLLVYRMPAGTAPSDVQGGGFLTMTVDLGVSEALKESVRTQLSGRYGVEATLTPVPVERGTVRVVTLGASSGADAADTARRGPRFVENIIASTKPSLYGDERAVFQAELTQNGAAAMRDALTAGGASPVVVLYDLEFRGLNPAYQLSIKIKFQQSYDYLRSRSQMNTLFFRTDVDREMEELQKRGAIEIREVNFATTESDPAKLAESREKLQQLARDLASWSFFRPALNPGAVLAQDRGNLTAHDATTSATANTVGFTTAAQQATAALTGVGATTDVGPPRVPAVGVRGGEAAVPANAAANPPQTPHGQEGTGGAVEAWNRAGRPQGAFMLRELSQTERQEITFDLTQVTAGMRSIAPQGQIRLFEGAASLPGRILNVDLDYWFFKSIEGTVSTSADLAAYGIAQIAVKLRYGVNQDGSKYKDEIEPTLTRAGESKPFVFKLDHNREMSFEYQVVVSHKPDVAIGVTASTEESPWIRTTTRHIEIDPRTVSELMLVDLTTAVVDWNVVQLVKATVIYEDSGRNVRAVRDVPLSQTTPSSRIVIRPTDARRNGYTVECRFFYKAGGEDVVTYEGQGSNVVVINQPPDRTATVRVTLADPLASYTRVLVELDRPQAQGGFGEATSLSLTGHGSAATWSFRRRDAADTGYRYKMTLFGKDGSTRELDWVPATDRELLVGDRAIGMLQVEVVLGVDLRAAGLRAARLKLDYPSAPAWADRDMEKLYTTGQEALTWRVPMQSTTAREYQYEVTWIFSDGTTASTGQLTSTDETLILPSPPQR